MASLVEFAKEQPRVNRCFLCRIPERREIEEGIAQGVSIRNIQDWLAKDRGYERAELAEDRLRKHFRSQHHTRDQ